METQSEAGDARRLAIINPVTAASAILALNGFGRLSKQSAVLMDAKYVARGVPQRRHPAGWRAFAYFVIKNVPAPVTFAAAVSVYAAGLGAISYPLWRPYLPAQRAADGSWQRGTQWSPDFFVDSWGSMALLAVLGVGVLWCAPQIVGFLTTIDRILICALLIAGSTRRPPARCAIPAAGPADRTPAARSRPAPSTAASPAPT